MKGTIKWYNGKKGYGFIQGEDGQDYFVHYSQVPKGLFLKENDPVTFEPVETEKGKQAQNIVKEGEAAPAEQAPAEEPMVEEQPSEEAEEPAAEEESAEEPEEDKTE